ncbi:hypothetical protein EVAR_10109_1 [Eumeta japonica]|uniref:Uncharacterized protein n=1 Tax=Eumeta variegata TaxID=151549 RepID=A0A4C1UCA7_EUMVA|nr:hypothetical protein EVAR_10109_1 [Eumeta japonica]
MASVASYQTMPRGINWSGGTNVRRCTRLRRRGKHFERRIRVSKTYHMKQSHGRRTGWTNGGRAARHVCANSDYGTRDSIKTTL